MKGTIMGIRQYKPTTPGRRQGSVSDFADITDRKKKPEKSLLKPKPKKGGRNNQGIVCTRFRGGGHKQMYRIIDFKRRKDDVWATVVAIEYDPNRSARIALLQYEDGEKTYILAPDGLKAGDKIMSGEDVEPRVGNCMPLRRDPAGHDDPQPRDAARPRRPDLPQRRHQRDADRPRRQVGAGHAAVRRSAPRQLGVPGDDRHRSATPST